MSVVKPESWGIHQNCPIVSVITFKKFFYLFLKRRKNVENWKKKMWNQFSIIIRISLECLYYWWPNHTMVQTRKYTTESRDCIGFTFLPQTNFDKHGDNTHFFFLTFWQTLIVLCCSFSSDSSADISPHFWHQYGYSSLLDCSSK